jgi:hypothetical protein
MDSYSFEVGFSEKKMKFGLYNLTYGITKLGEMPPNSNTFQNILYSLVNYRNWKERERKCEFIVTFASNRISQLRLSQTYRAAPAWITV